MALSNIWREPRREITETLLGLGVIALISVPYLYGDYRVSLVMQAQDRDNNPVGMWMALMGVAMPLTLVLVGVVLWIIAIGIHAAGEATANFLSRHYGIELRPKQRYR